MVRKLTARKTLFGERLRKCSDNNCDSAVLKYNDLCIECRSKHKVQSTKHMTWMIDKDITYSFFNKHIQYLASRTQYIS